MKPLSLLLILSLFLLQKPNAQVPDWSTGIASIIYNNCTTCHRPGEIAPFSLLTYEDAVNNAANILAQTSAGLMPPWPADPNYRHFLDEAVLSESDKNSIAEWVNNGTPPGDTSLAPDPPVFPTGSQLGTPDTVLSMASHYTIAGDAQDRYMVFVLPSGFTADKNISAVEFRPGNKAAVHHVFIYSDTTHSVAALDSATPEYGFEAMNPSVFGETDFITLYRPGMTVRYFPEGMAYQVPKGADIIFQIHYAPFSYESTDSSSVNIFFSDDDSVRSIMSMKVTESKLIEPSLFIPANTISTFHTQFFLNTGDLSLISISPHAHLLCSSFKVYGVDASGDTIPLVNIPHWNFNWQLLYNFTSLQKIENGTILYSEGTFDNTTNNPSNPNNPPVDVNYGLSSNDEMFRYFFTAVNYEEGDEFIDLDTSYATSTIPVEGIVNTPQFYTVYPNPACDEIAVSFFLPYEASVKISVFDLDGKKVLAPIEFTHLSAGFHQRILETSSLSSGSYVCLFQSGNISKSKVVIIQ